MWQNVLNGVLGLIVLVAAFMGLTGSTLVWAFGVLGLLIAIIGFSGSMTQSSYGEHQHSTR